MESGVDFRIDPTQRICEDCGNLVGKTAQSYPKYGYPALPDEKEKSPKDGILIVVTLIISIWLLKLIFN